MKEIFNLGKFYVSDFVRENESPRADAYSLELVLDDNGAARLSTVVEKEKMYGKYWYRSGTNDTMRKNLKDVVDSILQVKKTNKDTVWLDIACNDGTLLSFVPTEFTRLGIDPADNSYLNESSKHGRIVQDFFSEKSFKNFNLDKKCDVITTIAMFYDLESPDVFLKDIHSILDKNGLWVLQLSYTPLMLKQLAFDNICHEHVYYYSLFNLKILFERNNLQIVDSQINDVNGGSIRAYVMRSDADVSKFGTQPHRDVCNFRVESLLAHEKSLRVDEIKTWHKFFDEVNHLRDKTVNFIREEKKKGKRVWAYGASTKGNTLLQYFDLGKEDIDAIAERNPQKFGLKTVGTNIPIVSEEEMRTNRPDYLLVLPWHFISEFIERERDFLESGGKFIVPCPKFEIISKDSL